MNADNGEMFAQTGTARRYEILLLVVILLAAAGESCCGTGTNGGSWRPGSR